MEEEEEEEEDIKGILVGGSGVKPGSYLNTARLWCATYGRKFV